MGVVVQRLVTYAVALVFMVGQASAFEFGVWQFRHNDGHLMITTNDPHGIVVVDDGLFAAVNIAPKRAIAVVGFFRTGAPAETLKSTITLTDGSQFTREMGEGEFVSHQEEGETGYAYIFLVGDKDRELLKAAASWRVVAGGIARDFPMKGSRKAITAAEEAAKRLKVAKAAASDKDKWRRDCISLAGHPWDDNTTGPGVGWGDLDAEAATKACSQAIALGAVSPQIRYLQGRAMDKGKDRGTLNVLRKASDDGYMPATYHLGLLYWEGDYGLDNKEYGRWMIRAASESGYRPASHQMSKILTASSDNQERLSGLRLMRANADNGYTLSQWLFAQRLESGEAHGVPDYDLALQYYAMAADSEHSASAFRLAEMYRDGVGTQPNPKLYLEYLRHAADLGNEKAKEELGLD
ncbi:tetratricopeptide repeat protein [Alisedimentitalea sp. MJ-SS2]|uniref:tetratricopeptide repeat protein n=1 Tax=Aliisedimentitalea sp. MJ-SS2 TaxID=3049795 RepID=UPI0029151F92|nr:tetratricopeptide repeat protein [Alisedimentitalea sp. MJ-SS2]MDU8929566.1 tetratricopeptide repeat protein [Alisedimentitalea sp. MJ-SS2]